MLGRPTPTSFETSPAVLSEFSYRNLGVLQLGDIGSWPSSGFSSRLADARPAAARSARSSLNLEQRSNAAFRRGNGA
jgi:hypothetical protein